MTLYGAAKAPGNALREAGTTVVALTDSSGGTAAETLAARTNTAELTNSVGGTPADTLAVATNIGSVTDGTTGSADGDLKPVVSGGSGATAGAFNDATTRDAAITIINDNFKELIDGYILQKAWNTSIANTVTTVGRELILQRALNVVLINDVASLTDKLSDLITHMNDGR